MKAPVKIYLQWYGDVSEEEVAELDVDPKHIAAEDTTWAEDKIYNSDCGPYVLAEDYDKLREQLTAATAQRDRAMELVKETTSAHKNVNDYEYNDCDSIKCELCLQYEILRNEITKEKEAK